MSDTESTPAATPDPRGRRRWRLVAGAVLALAIAAFAGYFYGFGPSPPEVAVAEAGPGVADDIAEARREVSYWPFWGPAWGNLGLVLHMYGYFPEASACYARAAELDRWSPRWPYLQAVVLLRTDMDASERFLQQSVQLGGAIQTPRLVLGETLILLGRPEQAEAHFRFVLEKEPDNARALLGLGRVLHSQGDLAAARGYLEKSVVTGSRVKATRILLAEVLQRQGNVKEADAQRLQAAALPDSLRWPDSYREGRLSELRGETAISDRATELLERGKGQEAIDLLYKALPKHAQSHLLYRSLGRAHVRLGELKEAHLAYREGVRLKADSLPLHFELGLVLEKLGNLTEAITCFREVIKLKAQDGQAHYHLGRCLQLRGEEKDALDAYRAAVRFQPGLAGAHAALGSLLAELNQDADAEEALVRALDLDPANMDARRQLAELHARIKRTLPATTPR